MTDNTQSRAHIAVLLDTYGPLMTPHQLEVCQLYFDEDWSFSELAEHFGCSRSAMHDLIKRARVQLEEYEARLGHAAEFARLDVLLKKHV